MLEVPDFAELVAVIVAGPARTPLTTPVELTVATRVLLEVQVTVCPLMTLPFWSLTVATRGVVDPTITDADVGATVTVVTTGVTGRAVTVIADVPAFPELVAVIVAGPAATPETTPVEFTVATPLLLEVHVTVWPLITLPFWSLTVATRGVVDPATTDADVGATVTVVTTGVTDTLVTVIKDVPDTPELVAVIVAWPPETPATTPDEFTVATLLLLEAHVTVCPAIGLPF
jgi:hypothetical protein